ncbi:ABC transporter permease [Chitinophaga silvisoli]|uniref:ABC transporter permease n=1 Tax=Chitinophaga silvisoli TaxID=2291814 RepID=A0A3E1NZZ3_9BACT|nr:FtsX-like permease family protein [Chitinophaga silvisoli]RFM33517.1 ABC transporter permease [Chitinophaga silvisoli]
MWNTALRFMTYDKAKLIGILCGIVISIFLIGAQLGILNNILDMSLGIVKGNKQFIYVVDKKSTSSTSLVNVDKRVGNELQSIPGVARVFPVVVAGGTTKTKSGGTAMAQIIGVQYPAMAGAPEFYTHETVLSNLQNEGAVIIDAGDVENMENIQMGEHFTLNDKRVFVSGMSVNNAGLGQFNIITTIDRARQLTGFSANSVSAFLIKSSSTDTTVMNHVVKEINKTITSVKAYTGEEFSEVSIEYVKTSSGIVANFYLLIGFSLLTGIIIVGLTMFSSVNDHIRDYGTIKAIGGSNFLIAKLILRQSLIYAVMGFVASLGLLYGLQMAMAAVNQVIIYSPALLMGLFLVTLAISLIGNIFSMRKIFKLEPVQIFRM